MTKSLRVALQIDPLAGIDIISDNTCVLGLAAQELGYTLYVYEPKDLYWHDGAVMARADKVTLRREVGNHFTVHGTHTLNLSQDVDVILVRQDPPFDMGYVTNTHLLDQVKSTRIINLPSGIRNAPEKLLLLRWPHLMPPTIISSDVDVLAQFMTQHGDVIAKKIYGHGGRDVARFSSDALDKLLCFAADHLAATKQPVMVQAFLPEVANGDKRIVLFNGLAMGGFKRIPAAGEFLASPSRGGSLSKIELTARDREICDTIGPTLREMGIYFAGIDVIGDYLTEINVTSPAGLQGINRFYNLTGDDRMEMRFWKGLQDR